jgi:Phenazine biosynthesis-like protein
MVKAQIIDVFVDAAGHFGGGLGVIQDENRAITDSQRRSLAKELGYEETVFINNAVARDVSVYTPQREIPFAGQPMLGVAWLLPQLLDRPIADLHCLGGKIDTWQSSDFTWIRANLDLMPPWNIRQLPTVEAVEKLTISDAASLPHTVAWAWADEIMGQVRARTFAVDWDIPAEVQTNGSGSMKLAGILQRDIQIKHGNGSLIYAKPEVANFASLGGRVDARQVLEL